MEFERSGFQALMGDAKKKEATPLEKGEADSLSTFFKVFADPNRLNILFLLSQGELCAGDLAVRMGMTPSAVSHQLKILKFSGLVHCRREGKLLYYCLADEHIEAITKIGLEHIKE